MTTVTTTTTLTTMTRRKRFSWRALAALAATAVIALMSASLPAAHAQITGTAATLDTYQLVAAKLASATVGVADSYGNLFVGGKARDGDTVDNDHWIVRKSANGGTTWSTVDNFRLIAGRVSQLTGLVKDGAGSLYAAGFANDGKTNRWTVRKSINAGATWTTVDDYVPSAQYGANAYSIALDTSGRLYVGGISGDINGSYWFVRTSIDGGQTWRNSDAYRPFGPRFVFPIAMVGDSAGAVYLSGWIGDDTGYRRAIIRKSADGGLTWNTVSNVKIPGYNTYEAALAYDPLGNALYAAGTFPNATGTHRLIRKSTDGGATWTVVSDSTNTTNGLFVDTAGRVYATGTNVYTSGGNKMFVRRSSDGGQNWSLIEEYQLVTGLSSSGVGLMESGGFLYVVGQAIQSRGSTPASDSYVWLVRRL